MSKSIAPRLSDEALNAIYNEMHLAIRSDDEFLPTLEIGLAEAVLPAVAAEDLDACRRVIGLRIQLRSLAAGMTDPPSIEDFRAHQALAKEVDDAVDAWHAARREDRRAARARGEDAPDVHAPDAAAVVFAACRLRSWGTAGEAALAPAIAAAIRVETGVATPGEVAYVALVRARRAFRDAWSLACHEVPAVVDSFEGSYLS